MFKPIRVLLEDGQVHAFRYDEGVRAFYLVSGSHPEFTHGVPTKLSQESPELAVTATGSCVFGALVEL